MRKIVNIYLDKLKFGGIEKNLVSILNNLNTEKYKVNLIFLHNEIGEMYHQITAPFDTYFIHKKELKPKNIKLYSNFIKFMPGFIFRKLYKIPKADIEVIFPERMVPVFANKLKADIKCSWNQTSVDPNERLAYFNSNMARRFIYKWGKRSYGKLDAVICNSCLCREQLDRIYDLGAKAIAIPGYIDKSKISELASLGEKDEHDIPRIVFVGRLSVEKNIDLLLDAFRLARAKLPMELWIIGDGSEKYKLEDFIRENGYGSDVKLLGYRNNPYEVVKACDLLVSSSKYEGFGLTAVEAMALGVPVVSVDNGGISEIIGDSEYGILTPQSAEALADGIVRMLSSEEQRQNYISLGYARSSEYDIKSAVKRIEAVFDGGQID